MNLRSFDPCWFAVQVKPKYEKLTAFCLHQKGYEEFLPLSIAFTGGRARVERPLYPGYVFCRFVPNISAPILTTPGVVRLVGSGAKPIPITDTEIEAIRLLTNSGRPLHPWPFVNVGDHVRVREGPLTGAVGFLVRAKSVDRLVVSIYLLSRSNAVELSASWVESAEHIHALPVQPKENAKSRICNCANAFLSNGAA